MTFVDARNWLSGAWHSLDMMSAFCALLILFLTILTFKSLRAQKSNERRITADLNARVQQMQREVEQSAEQLSTLNWRRDLQYGILAEISRSEDLSQTRARVFRLICQALEVDAGVLWGAEQDDIHLSAIETVAFDEEAQKFIEAKRSHRPHLGEGLAGRVWASRRSRWISSLSKDAALVPDASNREMGSAFAITYGYHGRILGVLEFYNRKPREANSALMEELELLGDQLGLFFTLRQLEDAREHDLQLMHGVMELAHMGHWDWDFTTEHVYWSEELYEIVGVRPGQPLGPQAYVNTVHPEDRQQVQNALEKMLSGEAISIEHRLERAIDGNTVYVHVRSEPVLENGKVVRASGFLQDITERKRTEIRLRESEQRFASAFQNNAIPNIMSDLETTEILTANEAFGEVFGYDVEALRGRRITEIRFWKSAEDQAVYIAKLKAEGGVRRYPAQVYTQDHQLRDILISSELIQLDGRTCILSLCDDITERKKLEQDLRLAAKAMEQTIDSVLIMDSSMSIVSVNRAFTKASGYMESEALACDPRKLLYKPSGRHQDRELDEIYSTLVDEGHWEGELWSKHKSGSIRAELWSISEVTDSKGVATHYVGVGTDITEIKEQQERLEYEAQHDGLTGLANRQKLLDRIDHAIALSARYNQKVALLYLDLDKFKQINDTLGHDAGDFILSEAARRMANCVRASDTVSRLGGDEFVVMLEEVPGTENALVVARKLVDLLGQPYLFQDQELSVSASIGLALYPEHADSTQALMKRADEALYLAKDAGRNNVKVYAPGAD